MLTNEHTSIADPDLADHLRRSWARQAEVNRTTLVLNPVENFPVMEDLGLIASEQHGVYNSDKTRTRDQRLAADIQFAGRQDIEHDCRLMYRAWADRLGAEDATLRLLSGLHAHIILFMAAAQPGQSVLLLPVEAGGHLSGQDIVRRLGLRVIEMVVDDEHQCVDIAATVARCEESPPDFVLVDRSEGLVVEDFSALTELGARSIFDASQYLSNILAGDHPNPFALGFDLLIASVHKNFPGPQKALLATRRDDPPWQQMLKGVSTYVSNMHVASTYAATLTLARGDWLADYSRRMLACAVRLEAELADRGVPMVRRPADAVPTHHLWIQEASRTDAFETFEALEACRVLTNHRRLPYSLGFGLRLGTAAAARLGLVEDDVPELADLIADIRAEGPSADRKARVAAFSQALWARSDDGP
jgi:glycine hydroxymethyltransferase